MWKQNVWWLLLISVRVFLRSTHLFYQWQELLGPFFSWRLKLHQEMMRQNFFREHDNRLFGFCCLIFAGMFFGKVRKTFSLEDLFWFYRCQFDSHGYTTSACKDHWAIVLNRYLRLSVHLIVLRLSISFVLVRIIWNIFSEFIFQNGNGTIIVRIMI